MNDTDLTIVEDKPLTAEQIHFSKLVAKGYSYTQAYRKAFPAKSKLAYSTIRKNAFNLATKSSIVTEVESTRERTAMLARKAEDRLDEILTEDDSQRKGNKVAEVAMFMYEQANGKATQKIESKSAHVSVIYDLSGKGEPVPDHIKQQLENIN